ncbi:MAG: formylmethanofuran dehydrogenase [Deltaproteobacteria bacterium]|jgi:formylmethanofuran dehydrogenase subunit E|nr:formylmethanofuran dehydrogenase [Deltaproteobacteria bacterium]MBT4268868.1 formylmethanofuran dehydrogenase [Deltaproteobacteria bacterium]MBT4641842.1 formylmethanofuran dehydrogenase [Deltaproteobacteria bacterium]MBT6504583.1 formylmethanofuran dehydrogenase [Deltaproteobacteria bacterium]MBT6611252.1 formylmethanofuran dehydrogenase [Deltaproteobacteria bacterium]
MMTYQEILSFHGHECPGVAIGYRMATVALERLNAVRSEDEEVVAIVENDACGVDALQCVTGCTFGKGNLIFHDYGKQVYTLFSRQSEIGVRVLFHGKAAPESVRKSRKAYGDWILEAPPEELMDISEVNIQAPQLAQRRPSINCTACGESVMDTRIQMLENQPHCIPCANNQ